MIDHLIRGLVVAVDRDAPPRELRTHLDGIAALMENHLAYEERQLLTILESIELDTTVESALGPL